MSLTATRSRPSRESASKRCALHLLGVAYDVIDLWHAGEALRLDLRSAARDDDARIRPLAARLADCLRGLAYGFARHGARVDNHAFAEVCRFGMAAHHLGLVGVQAAAESYDDGLSHGSVQANLADVRGRGARGTWAIVFRTSVIGPWAALLGRCGRMGKQLNAVLILHLDRARLQYAVGGCPFDDKRVRPGRGR